MASSRNRSSGSGSPAEAPQVSYAYLRSDGTAYIVGGSLVAGLAKEAIDKNRYGVWDNGDLAATVAGGVTVGVVIELFRGKNRRGRTSASRGFRGFRVVAGR